MGRRRSRHVVLSAGERELLVGIVRTGSHPAQEVRRARILLELDEAGAGSCGEAVVPTQEEVARRAGVCTDTVVRVSRAYAQRGGDVLATIRRKKRSRPPVEPKVTGEVEARVIALACSAPPEGFERWSLRLLERRVALMDELPDLDHSTIGRILKKGGFART